MTTTPVSQSDARTALVSEQIAKWSPSYAFTGQYDEEPKYTIVDMENAIREAIHAAQNLIVQPMHDFANTLWSNENGGSDGRLSKLREQGHLFIAAAEKLAGNE